MCCSCSRVLLEEGDDVLLAHRLGLRDQALVDRDLVVLRGGGAAQDHRVDQAVLGLLDQRLALVLDALDRRARLVVDLGAKRLERLFQVPDLLLRLLRVVPELLLELRARPSRAGPACRAPSSPSSARRRAGT
jgi:hypothetical protein